jgi:hypothetical protein
LANGGFSEIMEWRVDFFLDWSRCGNYICEYFILNRIDTKFEASWHLCYVKNIQFRPIF